MRRYAAKVKAGSGRTLWSRYRDGGDGRWWIAVKHRHELYERDGWICQLCGDPCDPSQPNGDMGPSLDHIVPRSLGGGDEDSNLRTAHRLCNARRGNRDWDAARLAATAGAASPS